MPPEEPLSLQIPETHFQRRIFLGGASLVHIVDAADTCGSGSGLPDVLFLNLFQALRPLPP
jgi:hypothetical protein